MGRHPKERPEVEDVENGAEEKAVEQKQVKLSHKVVSYGDYLLRAREILALGPVNGMDGVVEIAVAILYSENEVVATFQKAGETKFVVKA